MTFIEYIKGAFEEGIFTDNNIAYVLAKYNVSDGSAEVSTFSEEVKDKCVAELHLILANRANGSGEKIVRGDFSIEQRTFTMTDSERDMHRRMARQLFAKYNDKIGSLRTFKIQ